MAEDTRDEIPEASGTGVGRLLRGLIEMILMAAAAFGLSMVVRATVAEAIYIPSGSMESTIMTYDRAITERISFDFRDPRPGDVVTLDDPAGKLPMLVKRVIAVGGQTVDFRDGRVMVDGTILDEPYVNDLPTEPGTIAMPVTVPKGQMWVMGDNRTNSTDSRYFGPQPVSAVHGRVVAVYWPPEHAGDIRR